MSQPDISVIVPTHNREHLLPALLASLSVQTFPTDRWELIVVNDGSTDATASLLERAARTSPVRFVALNQRQQGAATARNAGAARARGRILLFLDDDMLAAPRLIEEHVRCAEGPMTTVLGRIAPPTGRKEPWTAWDDAQLTALAAGLVAGRRAPGPRDFYSGNCSVPAALFRAVSGFSTRHARGEDFHLGYKLANAGARFVYCETAEAVHRGGHSFQDWLHNAAAFGRCDVALRMELGNEASPTDFARAFCGRHPLTQQLVRLCHSNPKLTAPIVACIDAIGRMSYRLGAPAPANLAYSAIYNVAYWRGLIEALGADLFWREVKQRRRRQGARLASPAVPARHDLP